MIVKQKEMDKRINYKINEKTIFASASSLGISAIKTVRISGSKTKKIIKLLTKKKLSSPKYYTLLKLYDLRNSTVIDKAVVVWFPGPKTYTGEDMLEINIHGSNAVLEHLIENLLLIENVREAKKGEFTKRAFSNNKMDFLEAEAVIDLINAETKSQKSLAIDQMDGNLSKIFNLWSEKLKKLLAHYESQIDFSEEEVPKNVANKVIKEVNKLIKDMELLLSDKRSGEAIRKGVEIVIIGQTNVGKSSLINQIAKKDIAIVSKISGTTRDIIETKINLANIPVIISDTAGLKNKPKNIIEKKGIQKALAKINNSDLKLFILDLTKKITKNLLDLIDENTLLILNKEDKVNNKNILSKIKYLNKINYRNICVVSAKEGTGINNLLKNIENYIKRKYKDVFFGEPVLTRTRHREALEKCFAYLKKININKNPELNAEDLRLALYELGNITGKYNIEEMLDIIFKEFCIGK